MACRVEVDRLRAEAERIAAVLSGFESELAEIATALTDIG
jgi:hypothetical protein